ncbi:MAG: hypothetical protein K5905_00455, partial [Roseibium sp.]|uniref:hypothetical protein n=1 Tax=Roseibium sp. TaxID=1936156 RepID=UPI002621422E
RKKTLVDAAVELLKTDDVFANGLQLLIPTWKLPEDTKEALEFKLLFATLNRDNYQVMTDPETGDESLNLVYPEELNLEIQSWQSENAEPTDYLYLPYRCEKRLQGGQRLNNEEAEYLSSFIQEFEAGTHDNDAAKSECRIAAAATLISLGEQWLSKNPEAQIQVLAILRETLSGIPSTEDRIRDYRIGKSHSEIQFAAYAVMHLWLKNNEASQEWEGDVLRLLTSGDENVAATVVRIAHENRERLGSAWWRLLRAGVLWSGLIRLARHQFDGEEVEDAWKIWLARLRRFPLRNKDATPDDLNLERVAQGCGRLDYQRRMRHYETGQDAWRGKPKRDKCFSLDTHFLGALFSWLIDSIGTDDWSLRADLALRLWDYEATRGKAHSKEKYGEYDLPSQRLGYGTLSKLAVLLVAAPEREQKTIWKSVLRHGPAAHAALQYFISTCFLRLSDVDDPSAFEPLLREMAEYGLAADWSQPGLWFYGERLICDLLGFGNESILATLRPGAALRLKDLYQRWAETHLDSDEESVRRFCHFLMTDFGAPLRFDGLRWLSTMLNGASRSGYWYREGTGDALVALAVETLTSDTQALSKNPEARQAVIEIVASLVAKGVPEALALQDRIKCIR